jgi:SAM-dependent methyltransferase
VSIETLVGDVIGELRDDPPRFLSLETKDDEWNYAHKMEDTYVRTLRDVVSILGSSTKSVLEIGALTGIVSICLRRIGHEVHALDIPELFSDKHVQDYYMRRDVRTHSINLRHAKLPFDDERFDLIIMCETLEHLNFNPIPVLLEISRVLKTGGYFYIAMPNLTRLSNRIKLLLGRQIYGSIDALFLQLSREVNMIVGIHWREYTIKETKELLKRLGFHLEWAYFHAPQYATTSLLRRIIFTAVPQWRETQVVVGKKKWTPRIEVWRTEANS